MSCDNRISALVGLTLVEVKNLGAEIVFRTDAGRSFLMHHHQDCCEHVSVEEIIGDLDDLLGSPILQAEEVSSEGFGAKDQYDESYTWTFYKLATIKGGVTIRWYGSSNGPYSEGVDFEETTR